MTTINIEKEKFDSVMFAEAALIASIIDAKDNEIFLKIYDRIKPDDFLDQFHKRLYTFISLAVLRKGLLVDKVMILSKLKQKQLIQKLENILEIEHSLGNLEYYIREISNASKIRKLRNIANNTLIELGTENASASSIITNIENKLLEVINTVQSDYFTTSELVSRFLDRLRAGISSNGISTGLASIDDITYGIPDGFFLIAARPSVGKTQLALQIAEHNASNCKATAIFSLEMNEDILLERLLALVSGVSLQKIIKKTVTNLEMEAIESAIKKINSIPLYIDASKGLTASEISAKAKRMKIKIPELSLIIVDYLQLISSENEKESQEAQISKISKTLKNLSGSLKCPVVALSQLSRAVESREDKRPRLSDLRGSGGLEQDSDVVIFLYSESYYNDRENKTPETEFIIAKNRNGPLGTVHVRNIKETQKFMEL